MKRLAYISTLILFIPSITTAINKVEAFMSFGVDNIPQQTLYFKSAHRCALACLVRSECQGYSFAPLENETDSNCFLYHWLTTSGGNEEVFVRLQQEYTTSAMTLGNYYLYFFFSS